MRSVLAVCVLLTVFGAINSVLSGMAGYDIIQTLMGAERTIATDFLRILIGLSALLTLVWEIRKMLLEAKVP